MNKSFHTIVLYPKLQPDTLLALYLLRKFGEEKLPGVSRAKLDFWTRIPEGKTAQGLEKEGYVLIDLGGSTFDHHGVGQEEKPKTCASELVASYLGIESDPALKKLLTYAKRDDLEGKGTISVDPLDRAFGLSGIIMNLNKTYPDDLNMAADMVLNIFEAHYFEEFKRRVLMPEQWKQLKQTGKAQEFSFRQGERNLRIIQVETDNQSLPGFLRAYLHADMVIVRLPSKHVNIITQQSRNIDLKRAAAMLRYNEALKRGSLPQLKMEDWEKPGLIEGVPEWFYDIVANTIQNGGIKPQDTPITQLTDTEILKAIKAGLEYQRK